MPYRQLRISFVMGKTSISRTIVASIFHFPSIEEQQGIAQFLDQTTTAIRRTVERYREQVELVREYRTRLIADVVTGKLDVREAAAGLPEVDPLAAEEDPESGFNVEAASDIDDLGVTGQEAEA